MGAITPVEAVELLDAKLEAEGFSTRNAWRVIKDELLRLSSKAAAQTIVDVDCSRCGHPMQVAIEGEQ